MEIKILLFDFLLENSRAIRDWKDFVAPRVTPFGTLIPETRQDVMAIMVVKDDPLPTTNGTKLNEEIDQEAIPSRSLTLSFMIPEEMDKYELDTFRKGHLPLFRIK